MCWSGGVGAGTGASVQGNRGPDPCQPRSWRPLLEGASEAQGDWPAGLCEVRRGSRVAPLADRGLRKGCRGTPWATRPGEPGSALSRLWLHPCEPQSPRRSEGCRRSVTQGRSSQAVDMCNVMRQQLWKVPSSPPAEPAGSRRAVALSQKEVSAPLHPPDHPPAPPCAAGGIPQTPACSRCPLGPAGPSGAGPVSCDPCGTPGAPRAGGRRVASGSHGESEPASLLAPLPHTRSSYCQWWRRSFQNFPADAAAGVPLGPGRGEPGAGAASACARARTGAVARARPVVCRAGTRAPGTVGVGRLRKRNQSQAALVRVALWPVCIVTPRMLAE